MAIKKRKFRKKNVRPSFPGTKISETFLHFAAPLLEAAGEEAARKQIEEILMVAFTVWNSVVLDKVGKTTHHVDQLRKTAAGDPGSRTLVELMILRKTDMFPEDHRLVRNYSLTEKNGGWNLWAEAGDPSTLP